MNKLIQEIINPFINETLNEIDLPIEIGDTVLMGKFKNKKVVIKTIAWNEKGDLLINGKSAMRMRIPKKPNIFDENMIMKFLTTIDMKKIIKEATVGAGQGMVDDGPSAFMGSKSGYFGRNANWAEKLGFYVVNYILKVDVSKIPPFKDELTAGKSVTPLPAGIGTGTTPNNPENLTGVAGYNRWVKNMKKIAQNVGFKLINFMDAEEKEIKKQISKDTKSVITQQKAEEKEKK